jgi:predicted dehydrogenase
MTEPARPVRLGIAGCGNVLGAYLATADKLHHAGLAEVVALCGAERHRPRAAAHRIPAFFTDYARMLARPDVDAVVLLTPMREHAPMAAAALRAGKHVLVEKPLAVTLDEARALVALAGRGPGRLVCAPFTVLSPTFQTIARRLRRGDIGRVVAARGRYGWAGPDWAEWFYKPGGGALFDLGVYTLTTLTGWLGPVRRVTAMSGIALPERLVNGRPVRVEVEDTAQVTLEFAGGCLATLLTGFTLQQYHGPGIELFGTEGTLYLHGDDWDPDGYELWQNAAGCWQRFQETHPEWPWTDGLRHLVECARQGADARPLVTPEHALHVLEVMIRAREAARDGRARAVESAFPPLAFTEAEAGVAAHRVHDRTREEPDH